MLLSLQKHVAVAHRGHSLVVDLVRLSVLEVFSRLDASMTILHVSSSVLGVGDLAQALFGGG